jgi:hypothetical protein
MQMNSIPEALDITDNVFYFFINQAQAKSSVSLFFKSYLRSSFCLISVSYTEIEPVGL